MALVSEQVITRHAALDEPSADRCSKRQVSNFAGGGGDTTRLTPLRVLSQAQNFDELDCGNGSSNGAQQISQPATYAAPHCRNLKRDFESGDFYLLIASALPSISISPTSARRFAAGR